MPKLLPVVEGSPWGLKSPPHWSVFPSMVAVNSTQMAWCVCSCRLFVCCWFCWGGVCVSFLAPSGWKGFGGDQGRPFNVGRWRACYLWGQCLMGLTCCPLRAWLLGCDNTLVRSGQKDTVECHRDDSGESILRLFRKQEMQKHVLSPGRRENIRKKLVPPLPPIPWGIRGKEGNLWKTGKLLLPLLSI